MIILALNFGKKTGISTPQSIFGGAATFTTKGCTLIMLLNDLD